MSINQSETLKSLQTQKEKLKVKIKEFESNINTITKELGELKHRLNSLNQKIKQITTDKIIISEHAILRYFERVSNINIDDIKKNILPQSAINQIKILGDGKYPVKFMDNSFSIIVKGNTVVTIDKK